jgi:porphobilinogen synthase
MSSGYHSIVKRPRRLRSLSSLRLLLQDISLTVNDLIAPYFVVPGEGVKREISSMPGQYQLSIDCLLQELQKAVDLGIKAIILFGIPESKDADGSLSWHEDGIIQKSLRAIKNRFPDLLFIADCCFCEYTDHGHCGVLSENSRGHLDVDNDKTCALLVKQAISLVKAGADVIAPSGMMDSMIASLRSGLDEAGFYDTVLLSYAVKYASSFYGPFRDAADGAPQLGDRKTYQMDYTRVDEALLEAEADIKEGADILMVKPAAYYGDIIYKIKQKHPEVPVFAYQVSGEYAMIKSLAAGNKLEETALIIESLIGLKRAGASALITYFAVEIAAVLRDK